jgi:predicted metal-dependent TIM-barrel fold hydrolase
MVQVSIMAVIEPAFWLSRLRTKIGIDMDYFPGLIGWERLHASPYEIQHYVAIGLKAKGVAEIMPGFAYNERVIVTGEMGFPADLVMP